MKTLTREQALQRLDNPNNLINVLTKNDFATRNGDGAKPHTPEVRQLATTLALELGTKTAAEMVGAHPDTVSSWMRGKTSHDDTKNSMASRTNQAIAESNREKASELAAEKVLEAIGMIDESRLKCSSAVELASVAAKLHGLGIKNAAGPGGNVNINIYVPQTKREDQFQTIEVASE